MVSGGWDLFVVLCCFFTLMVQDVLGGWDPLHLFFFLLGHCLNGVQGRGE